jgi:hypothetical protein
LCPHVLHWRTWPPSAAVTAGLDRPHHAPLATIEVTGIYLAIGLTVAAEHIRHLERGASHARCLSPMVSTVAAPASPTP